MTEGRSCFLIGIRVCHREVHGLALLQAGRGEVIQKCRRAPATGSKNEAELLSRCQKVTSHAPTEGMEASARLQIKFTKNAAEGLDELGLAEGPNGLAGRRLGVGLSLKAMEHAEDVRRPPASAAATDDITEGMALPSAKVHRNRVLLEGDPRVPSQRIRRKSTWSIKLKGKELVHDSEEACACTCEEPGQ